MTDVPSATPADRLSAECQRLSVSTEELKARFGIAAPGDVAAVLVGLSALQAAGFDTGWILMGTRSPWLPSA